MEIGKIAYILALFNSTIKYGVTKTNPMNGLLRKRILARSLAIRRRYVYSKSLLEIIKVIIGR
jgi:hypothetical protein